MKFKTILLIYLLLGAFSLSAEESKGEPAIEFSEMMFDFGTIREDGGPVSHEFEFQNTGDGPLLILSASASCGCTRPEYPTRPVTSGKKDKIKVTYNPNGRPGEFSKSITVRTNAKGKNQKKVTLKIRGNTTPKKP